jgi:two-component system phosphate regulon sensor histidine kinase PhoR
MHDSSAFWLAPVLRLCGIALAAVAGWLVIGPITGLVVLALGLLGLVVVQLRYLNQLRGWLRAPDDTRIPDGWGVWGEVFSELYRARRQADAGRTRLADALARMELAAQALPDGVVLIDAEQRIDWCNGEAERMLGIVRATDRGRPLTHLLRNPGVAEWLAARPGVAAAGSADADPDAIAGPAPLVIETASEPPRILALQAVEFAGHDRLVLLRDVTGARRLERMRRDFIANVSHELRTPLTVISGYLEHMASGQIDGPAREHAIQLMCDQSQRMTRLVEDLLTLSRLEAEDNAMADAPVDVVAMMTDLLEEGRSLSAGRHQIEAEADAVPLRGSADELRSAFANLMSNAIRYTPEGGTVRLRWAAEGAGAVFSVTDTGIGIAAEHIPRITERFYRIDRSRSRQTGGTGLGLAIVKHVLIRHQAALVIESEPGRGTVFRCEFPASRVSGETPGAQSAAGSAAGSAA